MDGAACVVDAMVHHHRGAERGRQGQASEQQVAGGRITLILLLWQQEFYEIAFFGARLLRRLLMTDKRTERAFSCLFSAGRKSSRRNGTEWDGFRQNIQIQLVFSSLFFFFFFRNSVR